MAQMNQKSDVVTAVENVVKKILFRNNKFIMNNDHLLEVTESAIFYLKVPRDIADIEKWKATYAQVLPKTLSDHRGYVQQECKKRAHGMSPKFPPRTTCFV